MENTTVEKRSVKKKRKVGKFIFSCFLFVCFFGFSIEIVGEVSDFFGLVKGNEAKAAELEKIKAEKEELQAEKKQLSDPNYIDSYARGKYMASKEGEQVFILPDDEK